jgi:hypothetical protein
VSGRGKKPEVVEVVAIEVAKPRALSRRRVLGGAIAGTLATVLLGRQVKPKPGPNRWTGKTRWIGHC